MLEVVAQPPNPQRYGCVIVSPNEGPDENIGRLTWWLARMARGGEILCPGPADLAALLAWHGG
jgi:hypothetical protein